VNRLADELLFKGDILARLQADNSLDEPLRQVALTLADRYREQPGRFNQASLAVVQKPGAKEAEYRLALRWAEKVCEMLPDRCTGFHTLAIAQFRLGQHQEAIATVKKAEAFHARAKTPPEATDFAILAMAQHHLGQKEQAWAALTRLQEVMKKPGAAPSEGAVALLREAEKVLAGKTSDSSK
jgi:tetratricopeptide (TPR) repeat protein